MRMELSPVFINSIEKKLDKLEFLGWKSLSVTLVDDFGKRPQYCIKGEHEGTFFKMSLSYASTADDEAKTRIYIDSSSRYILQGGSIEDCSAYEIYNMVKKELGRL